jgi:hypothetical protein
MCPRWSDSFDAFLADVGSRSDATLSLDRIDNDYGYECGTCETCRTRGLTKPNCWWATRTEQNNNRSRTVYLTMGERRQPLMVWARELGISHVLIRERLRRGWSEERALTEPYEPYRAKT